MLTSSTLTFSMASGERKRCSNMAPVRRLRSLAWMKARRLPGVRCSTLNTECRSLLCLMIMPGRSWVAGIDIAGLHLLHHVAHISTRNAVAMVDYARQHALPVTCEATPHHFALTDAEMPAYDSNYKMKPPLRSCGHRDAIVDGLAAGTISAIATDHAPHPGSEKMQEFERCPFGIIGLET